MFTFVAAGIVLAVPPQAGLSEISIEVTPAFVELSPDKQAEALIIARNTMTQTLHNIRLSWFANVPVSVTVAATPSTDLPPTGTAAWTLLVSSNSTDPVSGTVHLRVDYARLGESGDVPGMALGTLVVTSPKIETADQVAQVRAESVLTSLMEYRPGAVYLIVTNLADVPIQVTQVLTAGPDFVRFKLPSPGVTLAPRETRTLVVDVEATGTVRPGKHLIVLETVVRWERGGRTYSGSIVTTRQLDIGVVGETEILTLLGVPSFLILPGFLMTMTLGWLWKNVKPKQDFLKVKEAEFWFLSITLSLLTVYAYPAITRALHVPRDYLQGYGLIDIVWVWLGSIVTTAVAYAVVALLIVAGKSGYNIWMRRQTPVKGDTPISILDKLHRQKLTIRRPRASMTVDGKPVIVFLLQPPREGASEVWVSPSILVHTAQDNASSEDQVLFNGIEEARISENAQALADLLREGKARGIVEVNWSSTDLPESPYCAKLGDLKREPADILVEVE
jgi:hypothetical protein